MARCYGKVVFYDYDEICALTECNFCPLPQPSAHEDEMAAEPWFMVGKNDVFPGEFPRFLFRDTKLREVFMALHGDLATVDYWQERRRRIPLRRGAALLAPARDPRRRSAGEGKLKESDMTTSTKQGSVPGAAARLEVRPNALRAYSDVLGSEALAALRALAAEGGAQRVKAK